MNRDKAIEEIKNKKSVFIVRFSSDDKTRDEFVLTVLENNTIKHYKFKLEENGYHMISGDRSGEFYMNFVQMLRSVHNLQI